MNKKYRMSKGEALNNVASLLALRTSHWIKTKKECLDLTELCNNAIAKNRDIAIALGIDNLYSAKLALFLE